MQEKIVSNSFSTRSQLVNSIIGAVFLGLISQVSIPLANTHIPFTLQVFGLFLLVLLQNRAESIGSVVIYFLLASWGLPVLAGGKADAGWINDPKAGYLFGFLAAVIISKWMLSKKPNYSFVWTFLSLLTGLGVLLSLGAIFLSFHIGPKEAFIRGVLPFILGGIGKLIAAMLCERLINKFRKQNP